MRRFLPVALLLAAGPAACDGGVEDDRYVAPERAILTTARPIPPGTAPLGTAEYLDAVAPPGPPPTAAALTRGRDSYGVFCVPCHGASGHGDGPVTRSGFPNPPSFHRGELSGIEAAHIVAVIGDGKGKMLPMAERIPPAERWAIAYSVKALQLSPSGAGVPPKPASPP